MEDDVVVLVADDDDSLRNIACLVLKEEGYTVREARDGQSVLQHLRASPERLVVLLDWRMPDLEGRDVLEAVAAEAETAHRHSFIIFTNAPETVEWELQHTSLNVDVTVLSKLTSLHHITAVVASASHKLHNQTAT